MAQFNLDNYIDVQERINAFWAQHPHGAIRTRLMSPFEDFGQCRYEAAIYKDAAATAPDATGYAFEIAGQGNVNRTSHEENCETSAIGRALANMGYAKTRDDRPSRQEMEKVVRMNGNGNGNGQHHGNPMTQAEADRIVAADTRRTYDIDRSRQPSPDDMSRPQYGKICGMAKEAGFIHDGHLDEALLLQRIKESGFGEWPNLSKRQASQVIEAFNTGALVADVPF